MLLLGYLLLALVVAAVLFYLVVALLPAGLTRAAGAGRPSASSCRPTGGCAPSDLDRVRIPVSVRGYRFAETDELIDRLAAEIVVRDEEIARLAQGTVADAGAPSEPVPGRCGLGAERRPRTRRPRARPTTEPGARPTSRRARAGRE